MSKKKHHEIELITRCVKTAGKFATLNALYAADPSDDDFCHEMATGHLISARRSMTHLADLEAASLLALSAKARLARAAVDSEFEMMEESLASFLRSFIADTIKLITPLVNERRLAKKRADGRSEDPDPTVQARQVATTNLVA